MIRRRPGDRLRQSGDGRRESIYHSDRTRSRANDVAKQVSYVDTSKFLVLNISEILFSEILIASGKDH